MKPELEQAKNLIRENLKNNPEISFVEQPNTLRVYENDNRNNMLCGVTIEACYHVAEALKLSIYVLLYNNVVVLNLYRW